MKIHFSRLQIEPTRKCNQGCLHCCRDDAQSLDLTTNIVDSFFDNNDINEISTLLIGGGEPSLNPNIINYIIDKLEQRQIIVGFFGLSTNGLIYSKELEDALIRLNNYCRKFKNKKYDINGFFFISADQFHLPPSEVAVQEYKKLPFFTPYSGIKYLKKEVIEPYGNAVKNGLVEPKKGYEKQPIESLFRIVEYNNEDYVVVPYMYVSANGNIIFDGCASYDMMDNQNYGNVMEDSLENIFLKQKKLVKIKK